MEHGRRSARQFFFLLLATMAVLFGYTAWPIAIPLFLAATLAGVLWPIHRRLTRWFRGRRALSAGLLVFAILVLVVGTSVAFSTVLVSEGSMGIAFVASLLRSASV